MKKLSIKKIENGRAAFAFDVVENTLRDANFDGRNNYKSYIKKMPMMINVNGLAQTLAFYFSKGTKDMHWKIYKNLEQWIKEHYSEQLNLGRENLEKEFIELVINLERENYRMVTVEILNILNWMDRFVVGLIQTKYPTKRNGSDSR